MTNIDKAEALAMLRKHAKGKTVLGGQVYQSLTLETALGAIAALPARGVGVKPLVWEAGERDQRRADSILGEFCVTFFGGRWFYQGEPRKGMLDAQAAAQADYEARILAALAPTDAAPDLSDPVTVHANMLRGSIAKPTVEQIVHLYGREAFQPMIDVAIAKALEKACLAVSEHADWPEDEHGRTEQVGLFVRVINAIRAITPALSLAPTDAADELASVAAQLPGGAVMDGIKIKPLVWVDFPDRGAKAQAWNEANYMIQRWSDGRWELSASYPGYGDSIYGIDRFYSTLEAAKAAAQADYEARILAALAPTDAAQAREAHLREAAAAVRARYMGDNNREDQEVLRCEAAIIALIGEPRP